MRLVVIGGGSIVQEFLPDLLRMPEWEIIAVQTTPRSAEKTAALCARCGIPRALQSFDEVAALHPDAVYIAAPNHLHYELGRRALLAGCHVILEKPLAAAFRQAEALAALARRQGRMLFEAVTTPYLAACQQLRQWLPRLGTVRLVECSFNQYSRRYDAFRAGQTPPVFDPACGGGALADLNLYNLCLVMELFGAPQSAVYAPNMERGIDTSGVLVLRYPGFVATCTAAKDCAGPGRFVIEGSEGWLSCQYPPNRIGAVTLTLRDGRGERFDDGMAGHRALPEFTAFARAIAAGDEAFCAARLERSLAVSRVLTAARLDAGIRYPADTDPL